MCGPFSIAALLGAVLAALLSLAPGFAATMIESSLDDAGLRGTDTTVTVTSDPLNELLGGHADRVEIVSTAASIGGLAAQRLTLALLDVDLDARDFEQVQGRLEGVTFRTANGSAITADRVDLAGPAAAAQATVHIAGSVVEALAVESIRQQTGFSIGGVTLAEPDRAVFSVLGLGIGGQFVVDADGGLGLILEVPGNPRVGLVAGGPLRVESVHVTGGELVLSGTVDLESLLGN